MGIEVAVQLQHADVDQADAQLLQLQLFPSQSTASEMVYRVAQVGFSQQSRTQNIEPEVPCNRKGTSPGPGPGPGQHCGACKDLRL